MKSKLIIITILSLIVLLAVSCGDATYPINGDAAFDLTSYYIGNLDFDDLLTSGGSPEWKSGNGFYLNIVSNKIESAKPFWSDIGSTLANQQIYKSGSEYTASGTDGTYSESIKFTVSADKNTINVVEYVASTMTVDGGTGYKLFYSGTLTKQTTAP